MNVPSHSRTVSTTCVLRISLGLCVLVGAALWTLVWGLVALLVFSEIETGGEVATFAGVSGAVALGLVGIVLGAALARGRYPSSRTWLVLGASIVVLAVLPATGRLSDDHGASSVNPAVERTYVQRSDVRGASADCSYVEENANGSEYWICDVETRPLDWDTCNVDVRRLGAGRARARISYCLSDDF